MGEQLSFDDAVRKEFERLAKLWHQETAFSSSMTVLMQNASYQGIIKLGWPVVPILLNELVREPNWWFHALREITGESPDVPEDAYGCLPKLTKIWLDWGRAKGINFE
jgi:hypothetical protein